MVRPWREVRPPKQTICSRLRSRTLTMAFVLFWLPQTDCNILMLALRVDYAIRGPVSGAFRNAIKNQSHGTFGAFPCGGVAFWRKKASKLTGVQTILGDHGNHCLDVDIFRITSLADRSDRR